MLRILFLGIAFSAVSCDFLFAPKMPDGVIARVGDTYLYQEDIYEMYTNDMSPEDSIAFVQSYIDNWAAKRLLLGKAKINLPEDKVAEFDRLVANYRTDLYTLAYKEALVQNALDTAVTQEALMLYYEEEKENFKLKEKLIQIRFVSLPPQYSEVAQVAQRMRRFNQADTRYLDSISIQFRALNLNDSTWVRASRVLTELPALANVNAQRYLNNSQFFEIQDSIGVYLGKVTGVLEVNDIAPLSFVKPKIKQVLLNRRRLEALKKLEIEIVDEAIKKNEFEIYGTKE